VKHHQTWKLREHHLISCDVQQDSDFKEKPHLLPGDPLCSYFPTGTHIQETVDGLKVNEPGKMPLHYRAWGKYATQRKNGDDRCNNPVVLDVIVTGEVLPIFLTASL
jgi:hypothetical protein